MNSDTQSFELALLVLNLDKNNFNKMKRDELKQYLENNLKNVDPSIKRKILVASKIVLQNKKEQIRQEIKPEYVKRILQEQMNNPPPQLVAGLLPPNPEHLNNTSRPPQPGARIPTNIGCNYDMNDNGIIDQYACPLREYNPFGPCNKCNCGNDTRFPCNLINSKDSVTEDNDVAGYNVGIDDKYNYNNLLKFRTKTFEEALITPNDTDSIYEKGGYPKLNDETFNPKISRLTQPLLTLGIYRQGYSNDKSEINAREDFTTFTSSYNSVYVNNNGSGYIKEKHSHQLDDQPMVNTSYEKKIVNNKIINK
jgi:hypothetical protein